MRNTSDNVKTLMASGALSTAFIVELTIGSTVYWTTYNRDLVIGGQLYSADNPLVGVDLPTLVNGLTRDIFKITLADSSFAFRDLISTGVSGTLVKVGLLFINTTDTFLGVSPGEPLTATEDVVILYRGRVDNYGYKKSDEQNLLQLNVASPMAALDLTRPQLASRSSHRSRYPLDSCFDYIHEGSRLINLIWGKKDEIPTIR